MEKKKTMKMGVFTFFMSFSILLKTLCISWVNESCKIYKDLLNLSTMDLPYIESSVSQSLINLHCKLSVFIVSVLIQTHNTPIIIYLEQTLSKSIEINRA